MFVIGITGGIGSGKSFVTKVMASEFGAKIIDTDSIAHSLLKRGEVAYPKIVNAFGEEILDSFLEIDRKKLGEIVFSEKEKLVLLNSIVHPLVENEVDKRLSEFLKDQCEFVCLETALLHDVGYEKKCNEVWFVYAEKNERVKRLMAGRALSKETCEAVIQRQASEDVYKTFSDRVIDNSLSEVDTVNQIRRMINLIRGGKNARTT